MQMQIDQSTHFMFIHHICIIVYGHFTSNRSVHAHYPIWGSASEIALFCLCIIECEITRLNPFYPESLLWFIATRKCWLLNTEFTYVILIQNYFIFSCILIPREGKLHPSLVFWVVFHLGGYFSFWDFEPRFFFQWQQIKCYCWTDLHTDNEFEKILWNKTELCNFRCWDPLGG